MATLLTYDDSIRRPSMAKRKKKDFVSTKIRKILKEGVRRNTRKPVGKGNPRRKVSQNQAVAIALSMARKRGMKVGRRKKTRRKKG